MEFTTFYRQPKDSCFRATLAALGDTDAAVEALDEALVRAYSRWSKVSVHPNPEAWVVRTAINVHYSWWRTARRSVLTARVVDTAVFDADVVDDGLLDAMTRLPRRQREVVALRILLDMDTAITAETLGIAQGTVTAHLHRGLEQLRESVSQHEFGREIQ